MQNEADAYRKVRLRVEDVQGKNCLTNFWVCSHSTFSCVPLYNWECPVNMSSLLHPHGPGHAIQSALECLLCVGYGLHHRQAEVAGAQVADAH